MRHIVLALTILCLASSAEAESFIPTSFSFEITKATFESSGTDTLCFRCEDPDPADDFLIRFVLGFGYGGFHPFLAQNVITNAGLLVTGSLPIPDFPWTPLTLDVTLKLWDDVHPLPSISHGQFYGNFVGGHSSETFVFALCCGGEINGANFRNDAAEVFFFIEPNTFQQLIMVTEPAHGSEYTPAPEPATLLLLGGGFIAARVRPRWRKR